MNFDEHRPGWFCRATFPALILAVAALAGFWCAAGCEQRGEGTEQPPRQQDGGAESAGVAPQQLQLRIVSLSPAVSRTLVDLGLDETVVGRTPFCDALDAGVQIVGDLHELNYEMLVQLQPTHVLVQPPASGPKPELVAECAARGYDLLTWHLNGLRDIEQMVRGIVQIVPFSTLPRVGVFMDLGGGADVAIEAGRGRSTAGGRVNGSSARSGNSLTPVTGWRRLASPARRRS